MSFDHKGYATTQLTNAKGYYLSDLQAMNEDDLLGKEGEARSPIDFTYEVVIVNRRIASRMRGENPEPMKFEGWMVAPADFRNKDRAIKEFDESAQEMIDAVGDDPLRTVQMPDRTTTAFELANFGALHMMYHDAQLNYIQALKGDMAMHWE